MAVKIRLKRMGKIRQPHYRIIVADSRTKRDGRVLEEVGKYHPKEDPSVIEVDSDRVQYWLSVGAQPSEPVAAILKVTGDWQRFKGEPAPEPMQVADNARDKTEIFNEALKDAHSEPRTEAVTSKQSSGSSAATSRTGTTSGAADAEPAADKPADETPAAEKPADEASATEKPADGAQPEPAESGSATASEGATTGEQPEPGEKPEP